MPFNLSNLSADCTCGWSGNVNDVPRDDTFLAFCPVCNLLFEGIDAEGRRFRRVMLRGPNAKGYSLAIGLKRIWENETCPST